MTNKEVTSFGPVLRGYQCNAEYLKQDVPQYSGNPFIEALPEINDTEQVAVLFTDLPKYEDSQRQLKPQIRMHLVNQLQNFMQPLPFNLELEGAVSRVLRYGYTVRNPMSPLYRRQFCIGFNEILKAGLNGSGENITGNRPAASGFVLIGLSGVGKSTAIERTLKLYPQVIQHTEYAGETLFLKQLVWIKLECPANGSLKTLCENFFADVDAILGTNYFKRHVNQRSTKETLRGPMAQVASLHGLGVLVIDEIQRLKINKNSGEQEMLNYFTELVNTIGIPVILIGTYKSMFLFNSVFAEARRAVGQPLDNVVSNMERGEIWDLFLNSLWDFQWTRVRCPLTDELSRVMYDESQGIADIAVKLYRIMQWEAISSGEEEITVDLIKSVSKKCLKMIRPMLQVLMNGGYEALKKYEDLKPEWKTFNDYVKSGTLGVHGVLSKDHDRAVNYNNTEQTLSDLISIAMALNVPAMKADKIGRQVIEAYGSMADLSLMRQETARLALGITQPSVATPVEVKKPPRQNKNPKPLFAPDDPWTKVFDALAERKPVYDIMIEVGLIKPPVELQI